MLDTSINVKTDRFDGPLSLLLLLIQKEEMDVRELDLVAITRQYLAYLEQMRDLNFDVAGEYLYLAATLLLLKSKSCLNEDEKDKLTDLLGEDLAITSQSELIRRLEELQKFQTLGLGLWMLPKKGHEIFTKPRVDRKVIIDSILTPMDLSALTMSMLELMQKQKRKFAMVRKDRISIKEKLQFLKKFLQEGLSTEFSEILKSDGNPQDITNIIVTFISLLELARLRKVSIFQNENVSNIYVRVLESLEHFNVDLADSFVDEDEQPEEQKEQSTQDIIQPASTDADQVIMEADTHFEPPKLVQ